MVDMTKHGSSVFHRDPNREYPLFVRGEGCYLWDDQGTRFLDLSSALAVAASIGQGRAEIAEVMAAQARQFSLIHTMYGTNQPQEDLAARLVELSSAEVDRVMFTPSGTLANELSLRLARQYFLSRGERDRWKVISLSQSFHGNSMACLSLTGRDIRDDYEPYLTPSRQIDPPVLYRGPWAGLDPVEAARRSADALADAIEDEGPETVAAFFAEPISMTTGIADPPDSYWQRIREICDRYGILLITDEIITGVGRSGAFLCLDHYGVTADLANIGKGLSGGYAPIAATLIRHEVANTIREAGRGMPASHTYSGSPVSCAVGLAVLDIIEREGLIEAAKKRGAFLRDLLEERLGDLPWVGDIRGLGLMQGIEYVRSKDTREPYPLEVGVARSLLMGMWKRGFLLETRAWNSPLVGDCTLFVPALIVTEEQLEIGVEALRDTILEVSAGWPA